MKVDVILPKVDMDMVTGTISRWHVRDGDHVRKGQPLFDIETDKAAMEIEAPGDGVIRLARLSAMTDIPIGTVVAVIYPDGRNAVPPPAYTAFPQQSGSLQSNTASTMKAVALPSDGPDREPRATPLARRLAREAGVDLHRVAGSGPRGRIVSADLRTTAGATPAGSSGGAQQHFSFSATLAADRLIDMQSRLNRNPKTSSLPVSVFAMKALSVALAQAAAQDTAGERMALAAEDDFSMALHALQSDGMRSGVIKAVHQKSLSNLALEIEAFSSQSAILNARAGVLDLSATGAVLASGTLPLDLPIIFVLGSLIDRPSAGAPAGKQLGITLAFNGGGVGLLGASRIFSVVKQMMEEPALLLL